MRKTICGKTITPRHKAGQWQLYYMRGDNSHYSPNHFIIMVQNEPHLIITLRGGQKKSEENAVQKWATFLVLQAANSLHITILTPEFRYLFFIILFIHICIVCIEYIAYVYSNHLKSLLIHNCLPKINKRFRYQHKKTELTSSNGYAKGNSAVKSRNLENSMTNMNIIAAYVASISFNLDCIDGMN